MALYKAGVSFLYQDYVAYYNGGNPGYDKDKCVFFISGLWYKQNDCKRFKGNA